MEADTDTNKLLQKAVHFAFHSLLDQRDKELCKLNPGDQKRNQWFHTTFMTMLLNKGNADPSLEGKQV
jgi:succinate dehydrogenase flavin-adding protein (antitoxin of CptAB toxin-antitoxin module)